MSLPSESDLRSRAEAAAAACGVDLSAVSGDRVGLSPVNGLPISSLAWSSPAHVSAAVARAAAAYDEWRLVPAPVRGAVVRRLGELLREHLDDLATLVTAEVGKITSEARGEVQEMVDICDYAVGLSRQLFGRTMTSERPGHRLMETWHPLGVVGVISAFNFPVAVWSWNTAIALVCGDAVVWKPSEQAPLCALASGALLSRALTEAGFSPDVSQVVLGDAAVGLALVDDPAVALLSATGSTRMGREVGPRVAGRFGRSLLELGGNNAAIVSPSADLDLTTRGVVFSAAGTAGQRCTSMRRVIAHHSVADAVVDRVAAAYEKACRSALRSSRPHWSVHWSTSARTRRTPRPSRRPSTPAAPWSPVALGCSRRTRRTPSTCSRPSSGCRRSRRSSTPRRSRRCCT